MKKTKSLLFLISICLLSSCNNTSVDNITAIEIAGPYSVVVGRSVNLVADVIGTENDDVIWTSENTSIAEVNSSGVVTGINEGITNIVATSVAKPDISTKYEISVTLLKADSIILSIEENELITKKGNDLYEVPLGLVFNVDVTTNPDLSKQPENLSISVKDGSGNELQSNSFYYEIIDNTQVKVRAYESMNNIVFIAKASYADYGTQALTASLTFNVIDNNKENVDRVLEKINEFATFEKESVIKTSIDRNREIITNDSYVKTIESATHESYLDASYTINTIKTYNQKDIDTYVESKEYFYNGLSDGNYYSFKYDEDKNITELYENIENASDNYYPSYYDIRSNGVIYSHANVMLDILTSDTYTKESCVSLSNTHCYPNVKFEFKDTLYSMKADYFNDESKVDYNVQFAISLGNDGKIVGYYYSCESIAENKTVKYDESCTIVEIGSKVNDSSINPIIIDDYYFTEFDLIELAGQGGSGENDKFDYTNLDKYGSDEVKIIDGITTYILSYDKTLVLGIDDFAPSTASTFIDRIEGKSSDTSQIPDVTMTGDGIYSINAKKDDQGKSMEGQAIFKFRSQSGFEKVIGVVFTKTILESIIFDAPNFEGNDFGSIFVGKKSDYFFLNTDPDELIYTFGLEVLTGDKEGIELYDYEDNNIEGIPGFSYSILGKKAGSYTFRFYVVEADYIKTDIYSIVVKEPYSTSYLEENLVKEGLKYRYSTGTMDIELSFTSSNKLTFAQHILGEDEFIQTINYHFEPGSIIIEKNQSLNEQFYYTMIEENSTSFNDDLTEIYFYMSLVPPSQTYKTYTKVTFKKVIEASNFEEYANGRNATTQEFITGYGMATFVFTLNDGKGTFKATSNKDGSQIFNISFDYTYDKTYSTLELTNMTGGTNAFYISSTSCDVDLFNLRVRIKLFAGNYHSWMYVNYV